MNRAVAVCLWAWVGLLGLSSCNYHMGRGSQPAFHTLTVLPVLNQTMLPQVEPLLDAQLREQLLRAGTRIVDREKADATLQVTLVEFDRELGAVQQDDSGLARSYSLRLRAELTLTRADGTVLLNRASVEIRREPLVDEGVQVAEYQTLPIIARDLAQRISRRILDTW